MLSNGGDRRYFSFSASVLASLSNAAKESRETAVAKIQKAVPRARAKIRQ